MKAGLFLCLTWTATAVLASPFHDKEECNRWQKIVEDAAHWRDAGITQLDAVAKMQKQQAEDEKLPTEKRLIRDHTDREFWGTLVPVVYKHTELSAETMGMNMFMHCFLLLEEAPPHAPVHHDDTPHV
jgi:hypothetical protein